MDTYSTLLAVSLLLACAALAAGLAAKVRPVGHLGRIAPIGGLLALGFGLASALAHWFGGHQPGTEAALTLSGFLGEHPALLVVAALSIAALWLSRGTDRAGTG